jgi:hypothetical protein
MQYMHAPHATRHNAGLVIALLLGATLMLGVIAVTGNDLGSDASAPAVAAPEAVASLDTTGGVDETARGQAGASAAGASSSVPGGVDETARGQASASAAGAPSSGTGGVDETARGQAAAQSAR